MLSDYAVVRCPGCRSVVIEAAPGSKVRCWCRHCKGKKFEVVVLVEVDRVVVKPARKQPRIPISVLGPTYTG